MISSKSIEEIKKIIKYKFKNKQNLKNSLSHPSINKKIKVKKNIVNEFERLEFLGDRVLGIIISNKLIELYPHEKVGILDKKFSNLVNKNTCYNVGKKLKLNEFVLVGNSKKKILKIENKIISDICESIIGAIYLDKGLKVANEFILNFWKDYLKISNEAIVDAKTKLQEFSLKKYKKLPSYNLISSTGPRHKPIFKVGVKLQNSKLYIAEGSSKKDAEQNAAVSFLNDNFKK